MLGKYELYPTAQIPIFVSRPQASLGTAHKTSAGKQLHRFITLFIEERIYPWDPAHSRPYNQVAISHH